MLTDDRTTEPLAPHVALISIACFWAFYFVIWSLRGAVLYQHNQPGMLGSRAIVSAGSAGLTVIFFLLMRRVSAMRLRRSIGLALLLAVPAAILYSALNWYMFDHIGEGAVMQWHWSTMTSAPSAVPPPPPPPPPPPTPGSMSVGFGTMPSQTGAEMTPLQAIADQAANGYFFFIAWAALYLALCYSAKIGALERRTATLHAAAQSAELRALRYQINPHFLFNTLNSLSSMLLGGKRDEAERMILNLATFYRTSLTGDPTEDVRLSEEITLQLLYLDIEKVRFPDRLLVKIDVPDALLSACVPGLILQPLVENAVKYAVSRVKRVVTIRIAAQEVATGLSLTVEDDGDATYVDAIEGGIGVGLRNVRDRLTARYADEAACHWGPKSDGGFAIVLKLPLVRDGC
jgi:two-component system LytT family sensor kinase